MSIIKVALSLTTKDIVWCYCLYVYLLVRWLRKLWMDLGEVFKYCMQLEQIN